MANLSLWATFGFCLLKLCLTETQFNVSCRYGGVFHVEKNGRYSLTRSEAVELCRALNSTLSTLEQLKKAHELGFETCRYGFVVGNIVIPRINPYHLCAANHTGIYKLTSNTTGRYDAYCYNATETRDKVCEPIERLDTSFLNNQGEIVIDNADGSRYNADGTRHSGESSTSGADDENAGSGSTHDTTPMDTSIRRSSPSYYESATPVSQLPDHSSGGGEKEIPRKDSDYEVSPVSPDISLVTAADDSPERDGGQYPASTNPTQPPLPSDNEPGQGTEGITHPTDAPGDAVLRRTTASTNKGGDDSPLTGTITESVDGVKREKATKEPLPPSTPPGSESEQASTTDGSHVNWRPGVFPDTEDRLYQLQTPLPTTVASLDGAHHEDPTQPLLPSDNEPGQGTEGITHPTDAPGDAVLRRTTASTNKVTASTDVLQQEDITQEAWATRIVVTAVASLDGAHHEDPTQPPLPSDNEPGQGTEGITHPTDAPGDAVLRRTTAGTNKVTESVDGVKREKATKEPLPPSTPPGSESEQASTTDGSHVNWRPGVFPDTEDRLYQLQTPLPTRFTSSIYDNQGPHKGHYESTTFPGKTIMPPTSQPRSAQVPEWLIIVAALVALALILAVCIAVNSRRRCGQKKKLVINNGKGAVEDRKTSGLNGDASKSQEMVHLVHKEQSNDRTGACDEFLTINETQNHQELDMKTGV
ncbi:CD44 antigen isoform X8 [Phalacrocorax aristotelis]|uniref:CD44 antigen isoform X8 n=1 Tax=Phalacrocorax aristotelis TaxID=126867 RepID=UPI003F4B36A4